MLILEVFRDHSLVLQTSSSDYLTLFHASIVYFSIDTVPIHEFISILYFSSFKLLKIIIFSIAIDLFWHHFQAYDVFLQMIQTNY